MGHENNIVLGLDIGTTKICAVIAEYDREEQSYNILGIGRAESRGLKRGVVVDVSETKTSIKQAISQAQVEAEITTHEACIGIAGDHIHSLDYDATIEVSYKDDLGQIIDENDVENVLEKAKKFNLAPEREIIHAIPKSFHIDNEGECLNPQGMSGTTLTVNAHIIHGVKNTIKNLRHCVNSTALNVRKIVLEPLASARAVLSREQQELGVALIDIGGGTSDVVIYQEGALIYTGIIGYGGAIITKDIATIIQTGLADAERVKIEQAWASVQQAEIHGVEDVVVKSISGEDEIHTDSHKISEYTQARMQEILKMAYTMITQHVNLSHLSAGIVLTGGGSMLRGLPEMARTIFGTTVTVGYPNKLPGLESSHLSPEYATAVGLISWCAPDGAGQKSLSFPKKDNNSGNLKKIFRNIFSKDLF